jgi:hypothetical protein
MNRLSPALAVAVCLIAATPTASHAGEKSAPAVVADARLDEVRSDIEALFAQVDEAGLPEALFEAKVREGLVKKVAPAKILAALGALKTRCVKAKELITGSGAKPTSASIGYTAELLAQGVAEKDAARLLAGLSKGKKDAVLVERGLFAAIMMVEQGASGAEAVDRILGIAAKHGKKGIDSWIAGEIKKASKAKGGDKKSKSKKSKPKKGPKKGPGKSKSPKSHGK